MNFYTKLEFKSQIIACIFVIGPINLRKNKTIQSDLANSNSSRPMVYFELSVFDIIVR